MHIGIIGAGAAGVGLLDALAAAGGTPGTITVFDGSPAVWRGRPYQPDVAAVRVNAAPMTMSIRAGDQAHYLRWLESRTDVAEYRDEAMGQILVPRARYGEYLEDTARAAIGELRGAGWQVSVVNARVTGISRAETTVLHTEDGSRVPVDRAVLAVGNGRPRDHYGLTGAPGYVNEPYPLAHTLADIAPEAHVGVIGSGLTAVDIAAALTANGHTGPISFVSRSGTLPFVQKRPLRLELRHLTPETIRAAATRGSLTLDHLVALMRAELTDLGQDFDTFATEILATESEPPVDRLRRQLAEVDSPHYGSRLLVMAIRVIGPMAWPLLPESDRALLRGKHFRTINSLSSPMVPHNAKIVLRLLDSGQLRLRSGVSKIEARPGAGFTILDDTDWVADVVVNAVNPPAYTTPTDTEPLVSALLAAGAAELHPAGGLAVDRATRAALVHGRPDPTWHVLGNLAADSMFIATNPAGLAAEAKRLAHILTEIAK
ncbi:FAD/NAD(P)-binding protein [Nocardia sp. XZ_19_385]|uniref:FAD/NAD(P)-binding protein n=1 Tax=Nocardia sp. XZ_19_385 TaxID=2769488 RepID=UPI00188FA277|nr:FAD/NAD(P)-binding domain-containing protein [Nocardia sp. XZ_19_385]